MKRIVNKTYEAETEHLADVIVSATEYGVCVLDKVRGDIVALTPGQFDRIVKDLGYTKEGK